MNLWKEIAMNLFFVRLKQSEYFEFVKLTVTILGIESSISIDTWSEFHGLNEGSQKWYFA